MTTAAQGVAVGTSAARQVSRGDVIRFVLRRNPRLVIGGTLVVLLVLVALFAPLFTRYDPTVGDVSNSLMPPSSAHWLGTDDLGRDVLSRVIYGSRVSLSVAVISVGIGLCIGVSVGLIAGYAGGTVDLLLMRLIDALLAFPALLLAISITAALGPSIQNAMIAIGIIAIPIYARLTRAQVLAMREREFVTAARAIGLSPMRIAVVHMLPNIANVLIVQATLTAAAAILQEAVLSFLGLGAQPPTPSWGQDINYNQRYITNLMWWGTIGPGAAIFLAVFAFNFLGDALRDWLDPQLRRRA
ncbi:MAG: ABC transporter permease [Chloroflexi bacterium]|nr:ABC transporter permease [Chloroflexota bacterium]